MILKPVDIDKLPQGTMVYSPAGVALGVIREYFSMNGNRPSGKERHLDNGNPKDRFAYRRRNLYRIAKCNGVCVIERTDREPSNIGQDSA